MRPNRYVILVSVLLGVFGIWFSAQAVGQYLNTVRSFSNVELEYIEDSFTWEDPGHERAHAEFVMRNQSENEATISYLALNLYFDDDFAGARYQPWDPIVVPAGESVTVEVPFLVSIENLRPAGSEADLRVSGEMRLEFEGIQRDMTVRVVESIGRVPYEEN